MHKIERIMNVLFYRWKGHITENFTWTTNTMSLSKKAQQRLHFIRWLKKAIFPPPILTTFYRGIIESVLTSCITVWYRNCSAADCKTRRRTVNTAAKIIGAPLPSILDIFLTRCSSKANSIVKDPTHPSYSLFPLLPSGRRFRSIRARSARLLNSFFPQAVRALNSNPPAPLWNPIPPETWTISMGSPIPITAWGKKTDPCIPPNVVSVIWTHSDHNRVDHLLHQHVCGQVQSDCDAIPANVLYTLK